MVKSYFILLCAAAMLALASGTFAGYTTIDFEEDDLGYKPNGFKSEDSDIVSFYDSFGADLEILGPIPGLELPELDGQSLAIWYDDASYLIMEFSETVVDMYLNFGNDDPMIALPGDYAELILFKDGEQVAVEQVEMNTNDAIDQSIFIYGTEYDTAHLFFHVAEFRGLTEVVDNITFRSVPEPLSILLLGAGALLVKRRK